MATPTWDKDDALDVANEDTMTRHVQRVSGSLMPPLSWASEKRTGLVKQRADTLRKKWDARASVDSLEPGASLEDLMGSISAGPSLEVPQAHNASAEWKAAMEALNVRRSSAPTIPDLNLVNRGLASATPSGYQVSKAEGSECSLDSSSADGLTSSAGSSSAFGGSKFRHGGLEAMREMRRRSVG